MLSLKMHACKRVCGGVSAGASRSASSNFTSLRMLRYVCNLDRRTVPGRPPHGTAHPSAGERGREAFSITPDPQQKCLPTSSFTVSCEEIESGCDESSSCCSSSQDSGLHEQVTATYCNSIVVGAKVVICSISLRTNSLHAVGVVVVVVVALGLLA